MCLIVFINCLLNEFAISFAVVAVSVLNVSVCFVVVENLYCLPEYECVVSVIPM